jgi:hypothetical protein
MVEAGIETEPDGAQKMVAQVRTMVFGDTDLYRIGLSGRFGPLTRSIQQEFEQNEGGRWLPQLQYVLGPAVQEYPSTKGVPKGNEGELKESYTRDLGHDGWTVRNFWEAQPPELLGNPPVKWPDRNSPGGSKVREVEILMLRAYTGPVFKSWNYFLRYGPGPVLFCTSDPYYEHHNPALVYSETSPGMCKCGKPKGDHHKQSLHSWVTCVSLLYSGIIKVAATSKPEKFYRGVNEEHLKLPESFTDCRRDDAFAGGVELGAMSTTVDRKVRSTMGIFACPKPDPSAFGDSTFTLPLHRWLSRTLGMQRAAYLRSDSMLQAGVQI